MRRQSAATRKALQDAVKRIDERISAERIAKDRRSRAGELGIELAKWILSENYDSLYVDKQARAVLDALEGR